jgi:DNA invertase Pin-like site-specific DNA recombinase/transcription elongation factor Elf1
VQAMKNVVFYERISTTEQADHGYSLNDQRERLEQFCKIKGHTVHLRIKEDYSAKTFDRPEFKKLLSYIKKNRGAIDLLLVIKWDRFSRNATDALGMIRTLNKLGVEVNATEQPIDFSIPENKLLLSLYVTSPEVENDRRSLNVIKGMRRANLEGRYLGPAPRGYDNKRDRSDKPILVKSEFSKYISESFELIGSELYSQREVLRQLNAKGFNCSKTQFSKILQNYLYAGKVMVRATADEPIHFVTGIHEPIVSDELFIKVQDILSGRREKRKSTKPKQTDEALPLRGFLVCPCCEHKMTGSKSKGRSQHYHYYHCNSCNRRYRAEDLNTQLEDMIGKIQVEPGFSEVYMEVM